MGVIQGGVAAETVQFVISMDVDGWSGGCPGLISVEAGKVALCGPTTGVDVRSTVTCEVELLWLTPTELATLADGPPVATNEGLGAAMVPLLVRLAVDEGKDGRSRADRQRVAIMLRGLLSAAAAQMVLAEGNDASSQQRLVVMAMQLVHSRLEEPALTSAAVAGELDVSLRTLQSAFRQSSTSLADWIRLLRLERTWIDIATTPAESPLDMSALGARWGFRGRDHFTRAFQRRYGVRPDRVGESRSAG